MDISERTTSKDPESNTIEERALGTFNVILYINKSKKTCCLCNADDMHMVLREHRVEKRREKTKC